MSEQPAPNGDPQSTPQPDAQQAADAAAYYAYYYGQRPQQSAPQGGRPPGVRPVGLLLSLGLVLCVFACCMVMSALSNLGGGGGATSREQRKLTEVKVSGEGEEKIALIELKGVIAEQQVSGGVLGTSVNLVERLQKEFAQAAEDPQVKAVLFRIDSPGGTVSASDQIWHLVKEFRRTTSKPVVVHMGGTCASGGYYIAVACDELLCEPTTITGSIGVILSTLNFSELLAKYGVEDVTIKSGPNKDLLNSTAPQRAEHRKILQGMVDESYERFVQLVDEGRPFDLATAKEIGDGRIYTAKQALELKLVDGIGYREDALAVIRKRANLGQATLVRYQAPIPSLLDALGGSAALQQPSLGAQAFEQLTGPRLLVIWRGR